MQYTRLGLQIGGIMIVTIIHMNHFLFPFFCYELKILSNVFVIYFLKVNNGSTWTVCEICSKLTM